MDLIKTLRDRFVDNLSRHPDITWHVVEERLRKAPDKLEILRKMEETGGEPDVIGVDAERGEIVFCDCSAESPSGRRSLCYDRAALEARKKNKPVGNVLDLVASMGVELLTETQYRELQKLGEFDLKTSSWIVTPVAIRKRGGALFCDRRYDHVFTYHNGAESYYAARGFRCRLIV